MPSLGVTKENTEHWTRRRAFAQVRHRSNIQLLPYSLVSGLLGTDDSTSYEELSGAMQSISRVYHVAYKFDLHVSPVLTELLSSTIRRTELL
jgi:hypothetical protein